MANSIPTEQRITFPESQESNASRVEPAGPFPPSADSRIQWNFTTVAALLLLVALWAVKLYTTWGAWGNLTVDSGHEMYVPAMLAEGKVLYRDLWFPFGPAAPYFTSYLYRLFGVKLNVLYWAGALSALGSAIFLYLTGMRFSSRVIGWTVGAVLLMEAFEPSIFCFPLPYSSAAVYGCFTGCLFLWLVVSASYSNSRVWIFSAGSAAAFAFLLKPEFGLACYGTLALLIAARWFFQKSWGQLAGDIGATLPGVLICGLAILWMISIAGAEFITQENVQSWPTSYFMKTYGKTWLAQTGFTVSGADFQETLQRAVPVAMVMLAAFVLLRWRRLDARSMLSRALIFLVLALYFIKHNYFLLSLRQNVTLLLSTIFFPRDMVLYILVATVAAWGYFWWRPATARNLAFPLLFTFSGLLAFRVLMKMNSMGYPVLYNGPVILSFLLLVSLLIPRIDRSRRFVFLAELVLCLAILFPLFMRTQAIDAEARDFVPLTTFRGTIRVSPHMAENYIAALSFMKQKAALGQSVLSVPEDTSLYFLSGTYCPTRVYLFIPGSVAPGKMTRDAIGQIERKPVDYLIWSNREFAEYGAPEFGKDFDTEIGDYLKSHYRPVGPLLPATGNSSDWTGVIWERRPSLNQEKSFSPSASISTPTLTLSCGGKKPAIGSGFTEPRAVFCGENARFGL